MGCYYSIIHAFKIFLASGIMNEPNILMLFSLNLLTVLKASAGSAAIAIVYTYDLVPQVVLHDIK